MFLVHVAHEQRNENYARNLPGFLLEVAQVLVRGRPGNPLLKPQYVAGDPPEQILNSLWIIIMQATRLIIFSQFLFASLLIFWYIPFVYGSQYLLVRDSKLRKHSRCRRATFHGFRAGLLQSLHHVIWNLQPNTYSSCWDFFAIWFLFDFMAPQLNSSVSDMMVHDLPWSPQLQASLVESKLQLQDFLGARGGFWWPPMGNSFPPKLATNVRQTQSEARLLHWLLHPWCSKWMEIWASWTNVPKRTQMQQRRSSHICALQPLCEFFPRPGGSRRSKSDINQYSNVIEIMGGDELWLEKLRAERGNAVTALESSWYLPSEASTHLYTVWITFSPEAFEAMRDYNCGGNKNYECTAFQPWREIGPWELLRYW